MKLSYPVLFFLLLFLSQTTMAKSISYEGKKIFFGQKVNRLTYRNISKSIALLSNLKFENLDYQLQDLLDQNNSSSIIEFIFRTVTYIVSDSDKRSNSLFENLGQDLKSKQVENYIFKERFKRKIKIPLTSSSAIVGIIQLNQKLFLNRINYLSTFDQDFPKYDTIINLAHEGFHSLENGHAHIQCPQEHIFSDQLACDQNISGPYFFTYLIVQELIKACHLNQLCTETTLNLLKISATDFKNRIISLN